MEQNDHLKWMSFLLKWYSSFRKSYSANFEGLFWAYYNSSSTLITFDLNSLSYRPAASSYSIFSPSPSPQISYFSISSYFSSTPMAPSMAMSAPSSLVALQFLACSCSICNIFLCLKAACSVLFFLMKQMRSSPSHSRKSISGSGFLGYILTMLLSTLGGGLKLFLPTLIRWSTFASSCTLTLRRQQRSEPGFAISRCANSFWNMRTAHRNMGFWARSLKVSGELIWQGMFATQISKKGSSTESTSPGMSVNLLAYQEYLNLLDSYATMRGSISIAITFFARYSSSAVRLPVPGPISRTTSVGRMADLATISESMCELMRMCWPQDLLKTMPVLLTVCFSFIIVDDILTNNYNNVHQPYRRQASRSFSFLLCGLGALVPEDEEAEQDVSVHGDGVEN